MLPQKKQSLLFSATFSDGVKGIADRLLNAPALIGVARRNQTAELIAQKVHPVGREMRRTCWSISSRRTTGTGCSSSRA